MEFVVVGLLIVAAVSLIWAQWIRPMSGKAKPNTRKRQAGQAKGHHAAVTSTYQPTYDIPGRDGGGPTATPCVALTGTIPCGSEAAARLARGMSALVRESTARLARDMSALVEARTDGQLGVSQTFEEAATTPLWSAASIGGPA